jgi:DNA repair protein RAD50
MLTHFSIIESRQEKKNFQLVVITHDDTFIKMLGQSAFSESYYRVQKPK